MKFTGGEKNQRQADQPNGDAQTRSEPKRHANHDAATCNGRETPEKRANKRKPCAPAQPAALKRATDERWMCNRNEDSGEDRDAGIKEEASGKPVAEDQERSHC